MKPVPRKRVKAPKGAELRLESPSRLKAKGIKASFSNDMVLDNPYTSLNLKQFLSKRKVDKAFQVSKKRKPVR